MCSECKEVIDLRAECTLLIGIDGLLLGEDLPFSVALMLVLDEALVCFLVNLRRAFLHGVKRLWGFMTDDFSVSVKCLSRFYVALEHFLSNFL
mgnify:FL=1